jgi:hypothetical protein
VNRIETVPELPAWDRWRYVLGIDYGNVNATALVVLAFCKSYDDLYAVDCYAAPDLDPEEAAELVYEWREHFGDFEAIVGDVGGLGKGYAELARNRWGIPIEPAEKTNKLGYQKLMNGDLERARLLLVSPNCDALAAEMKALHKAEGKENEGDKPRTPNHLCDAALYAFRRARHWQGGERRQPPPEPGTQEWQEAEEARMLRLATAEARRARRLKGNRGAWR